MKQEKVSRITKNIGRSVDITTITKDEFEKYMSIPVYQHPKFGAIIARYEIKKYIPECMAIFKSIKNLEEMDNFNLSQEEAGDLGVKPLGNPKMGVVVCNELSCKKMSTLMNEEIAMKFLKLTHCVFHRKELERLLYPDVNRVEEAKGDYSDEPKSSHQPSHVDIVEIIAMNNKLLSEQNECQKKILESMQMIEYALTELTSIMGKISNTYTSNITHNEQGVTEIIPVNTTTQTGSSNITPSNYPVEPVETVSSEYEQLKQFKSNGVPFTLKTKRESSKDLIYRRRPEDMQKYSNTVLHGVPTPLHKNVLNRAYIRMRDVYGVPIELYKNDYFADTGKQTKNSLEIVHWLEFRNPVIKGLLRCCIETVYPECAEEATQVH